MRPDEDPLVTTGTIGSASNRPMAPGSHQRRNVPVLHGARLPDTVSTAIAAATPTASPMAMYDDKPAIAAIRQEGSSQPARARSAASGRGANKYSTTSERSAAAV